jgi:hypothetical protein
LEFLVATHIDLKQLDFGAIRRNVVEAQAGSKRHIGRQCVVQRSAYRTVFSAKGKV